MTPAGTRGRPTYPRLLAAVLAQWDRIEAAVSALPPERLAEPTRLACTTGELVAHLAGNAGAVLEALDTSPEAGARLVPAEAYFDDVIEDADDIAARARSAAAGTTSVTELLRATLARARAALTADPAPAGDRRVVAFVHPMLLADFLATRAVEAVVHGLDLPDPVAPDPEALRATVRLLAGILARRAPGRTVEVRIPPYAAVQVALPGQPGPRHTRGTPPNVVEADPIAFVEVATGRVPWPDAVADGRIRASGERADLRPLLPLC